MQLSNDPWKGWKKERQREKDQNWYRARRSTDVALISSLACVCVCVPLSSNRMGEIRSIQSSFWIVSRSGLTSLFLSRRYWENGPKRPKTDKRSPNDPGLRNGQGKRDKEREKLMASLDLIKAAMTQKRNSQDGKYFSAVRRTLIEDSKERILSTDLSCFVGWSLRH